MTFLLSGKSAIVTGAGGGIGRCIALALAKAGASVIVNDVNKEEAARTACMIRKPGDSRRGLCRHYRCRSGGHYGLRSCEGAPAQIDILVNNAGDHS